MKPSILPRRLNFLSSDFFSSDSRGKSIFLNFLSSDLRSPSSFSNFLSSDLRSPSKFSNFLSSDLRSPSNFSNFLSSDLRSPSNFSNFLSSDLRSPSNFSNFLSSDLRSPSNFSNFLSSDLRSPSNFSNFLSSDLRSPSIFSLSSFSSTSSVSAAMSPKIVFGMMGSSVISGSSKMATPEQVQAVLDVLKRHNVTEIDTARIYNGGRSEELLGLCKTSAQGFSVQTKAPGFSPGSLQYESVIGACNASLSALDVKKVDIYYFHGPDRSTELEESLRAANELYEQGKYERLGISNHSVAEMKRIDEICSEKGWVKPTVYQGQYNPLMRGHEKEMLPTLRRLGIAYYAYSPLAGGFLAKSVADILKPEKGSRFDAMKVFGEIYVRDETIEKRKQLEAVCAENGMTVKEATMRWFMHHGGLGENDGVILGASSVEQTEENLRACEAGPLPQPVVTAFEEIWQVCEPLMGKWVF